VAETVKPKELRATGEITLISTLASKFHKHRAQGASPTPHGDLIHPRERAPAWEIALGNGYSPLTPPHPARSDPLVSRWHNPGQPNRDARRRHAYSLAGVVHCTHLPNREPVHCTRTPRVRSRI
jgi:hypothetical protein